jgi:N6-adenosine-specific RNA methylase IME4/ParB-like chromosome segregation protein Spo0J
MNTVSMPINSIIIPTRRRRVSPDKVRTLSESIGEIGLINPVTLSDTGELLAGLHRVEACKLLGWLEVPAQLVGGLSALQSELVEIDENLIRNELSTLQQGEWLNRRDEVLKELGMRQTAGGDRKSEKYQGEDSSLCLRTTAAIAADMGMSERIAQQRKQIARDIVQDVKEQIYGTALEERTTDLLKLSRMQPAEQAAIVDRILSGEAKSTTEAVRQINHESKREAAPITGKYRVFYADPPWTYGDTRTGLEGYSAAVDHYPAMSIEDLCSLPVKDAAEDNAVLFLWVTSPLLEECFAVINAWGFKYKTSFVWDKIRHNVGHYNSVRHELLLICTRGSCTPDNVKLFDSVQTIERTEKHSQKPAEFREIIETLYTSGNKIELFCREPAPGWSVWGNEC